MLFAEVYNGKGSVWARNLSTYEKYYNESGKTNNKYPQVGYVAGTLRVIEFHLFWNSNENFRIAGKIREGREPETLTLFALKDRRYHSIVRSLLIIIMESRPRSVRLSPFYEFK